MSREAVCQDGRQYAAMRRLHRFLVAGAATRLHGHEITVLYGLKVDRPICLGRGAYLADYDDVRRRFGLDEDPEPWLEQASSGPDAHPGRLANESSRSVLVRVFDWGLRWHPATGLRRETLGPSIDTVSPTVTSWGRSRT